MLDIMRSPLCSLRVVSNHCTLAFAFRFQLNCKKGKVDEYPIRKPNAYSAQLLASQFSSDSNNENLKDETCQMPLSKSLVGGSMNICKIRILNFIQTERVLQGELTFCFIFYYNICKLILADPHN